MSEKQLKIPEVGEYLRHVGRLVKIENSKPLPPPPDDYIFEETEYKMFMKRNGEILKGFGAFMDEAKDDAIKEMTDYAKSHNITKDSEVELVVVEERIQYRMRPTHRRNFYAEAYTDFEVIDTGSRRGLPEPKLKVIWSSKTPDKTQDEKHNS